MSSEVGMSNYFRYLGATFVLLCLAIAGRSAPKDIFDSYFEKRQRAIDKKINEQHLRHNQDEAS